MVKIKEEKIIGSRRLSNYFWATIILLASLSFMLAGFSSYLSKDILPFFHSNTIEFIPQGVVMIFYGTLGICLSLFLWLTIFWNVGGGYNRFDNSSGIITIFRKGFPGENRLLFLQYYISDIQAIKVIINDSFNPKREIYLKTKDNREIPLTRVGQPLLLSEIEQKASDLAKFLDVSLEGLD